MVTAPEGLVAGDDMKFVWSDWVSTCHGRRDRWMFHVPSEASRQGRGREQAVLTEDGGLMGVGGMSVVMVTVLLFADLVWQVVSNQSPR